MNLWWHPIGCHKALPNNGNNSAVSCRELNDRSWKWLFALKIRVYSDKEKKGLPGIEMGKCFPPRGFQLPAVANVNLAADVADAHLVLDSTRVEAGVGFFGVKNGKLKMAEKK